MESPNRKSSQKSTSSQPAAPSSTKGAKNSPPRRPFSSHSVVLQKPPIKENSKQLDIKLHTEERAARRALFNSTVAIKLCIIEQRKRQVEKLLKVIEEEEVKMLRKEMIPRAQLMPFFDRPFFPQRSTRPLTVPREPSFYRKNSSFISCR
ncbi:Germin-like protein subfamily 1 member 16 [Olea europaea subsp. europaea]|uniref:Germin-like protein subfamily 1 member 16 n=1 Tax=Olea europaea subsp. europaea TaxID=158383 RepID=A0A8S0TXR3_OLEEU|nr:Germin-like protein subfamily 1 member 16 [Olea europaea subsp. europaea]